LIRIRNAQHGAGWDFGGWKNDAGVVVVCLEFEDRQLAFVVDFSAFLVDQKNFGLA
jgi:hypothetical protein